MIQYSVAVHEALEDILQLMVGYYELEVQVFLSVIYKLEYDQILLAYYFSVFSGHPCPKFFAESDTLHPCRIPTPVSDSKCYLPCPRKICRIRHPNPCRTLTPCHVSKKHCVRHQKKLRSIEKRR
uniref:Uncharacterized protein n=1 Tax=Arundo donax TaxID=35708 RepID=A0A0A9CS01_ARUDO